MGVLKQEPKRSRAASVTTGISGTAVLALGVVGLILVLMLFDILPSFRTKTIDRNQTPVLQRLERLNKFTAATGTFNVVIDTEKDVDGVPSVLAGERTVLIATGSVDAQVDFTGLRGSAVRVSDDGKSVTVAVPQPVLTPARLDNSKTYVVSRSRGVLDRIADVFEDQPVDDQPLYVNAEDELESAAANSELLNLARNNTQDMLTQMLTSLGFEKVEVVFAGSPPSTTGASGTAAAPTSAAATTETSPAPPVTDETGAITTVPASISTTPATGDAAP